MLNFVAIDFETANAHRASVCQVGLAIVQNSIITSALSTLVRPPAGFDSFSEFNIRIHGIKPTDVINAPTWDIVAPYMLGYLRNQHVVAHNASFETSVIKNASQAVNFPMPPIQINCSLKLSRRINPEFQKHKLNLIMKEFGMKAENHHDAGADAMMNAQIVLAMAQKAHVDSFEELFNIGPHNYPQL